MARINRKALSKAVAAAVLAVLATACGNGSKSAGDTASASSPASSDSNPGTLPNPTGSSGYALLAWNDLGMHCLNPSYDAAVILPPYNTVMAQVVKRGNPPQAVTSGLTVSYRILNNTKSSNKGTFGQFWT